MRRLYLVAALTWGLDLSSKIWAVNNLSARNPVEIAVEKELGFAGKGDIEKFGIAAFNDKCRESVQRHVGAFTDMTNRMGFWVDFEEAYWTMSPQYVESVWWSLKEIWQKGLLVQDHRVAPYCPRCGTGLSDHELAQGYETVTDPSVFVRFPVTSGPLQELGAALLVWTTTVEGVGWP